ncbi:MAG: hypothetical protein HC882_06770, partial [Acidobacteria bacterium]|nr:hypothetical protein [Acidobacteriota bacterium]
CGFATPARYDAAMMRNEIGGVMISDVKAPAHQHEAAPDLQYVEL